MVEITQDKINELYEKAYLPVNDVMLLTGKTRSMIWFLVNTGKFKARRNEQGEGFISTIQVREYVIGRRQVLLNDLAKLKLPA